MERPMPKPPTTTSKTAEFLARSIEFSGKTQREIAKEAGIAKPNVINMMKLGQMPVPLDRIPGLARACPVDPVYFLRLAMAEYTPETYAALVNTLGEPLTANEWEMVLLYRLAAPENEIEVDAPVAHAILDALMGFRGR
jgi:transcriptional regulator with XRE-family HTH domain